jgi:predicted RNase H-like nuclease (RuvC/YqgF family)
VVAVFQIAALDAQIAAQREQIDELSTENSKLSLSLSASKEKVRNLEESLSTQEADKAHKEKEFERAKDELAKLKAELNEKLSVRDAELIRLQEALTAMGQSKEDLDLEVAR